MIVVLLIDCWKSIGDLSEMSKRKGSSMVFGMEISLVGVDCLIFGGRSL